MKKKEANSTDEPIGQVDIVEDFLPKPCELVMKDEIVNVIYWHRLIFCLKNCIL